MAKKDDDKKKVHDNSKNRFIKESAYDSAKKRMKQNKKRRLRNRMLKSKTKTEIKKYKSLILNFNKEDNDLKKEDIIEGYKKLISALDKTKSKGIYKLNNIARKKSRLYNFTRQTGIDII